MLKVQYTQSNKETPWFETQFNVWISMHINYTDSPFSRSSCLPKKITCHPLPQHHLQPVGAHHVDSNPATGGYRPVEETGGKGRGHAHTSPRHDQARNRKTKPTVKKKETCVPARYIMKREKEKKEETRSDSSDTQRIALTCVPCLWVDECIAQQSHAKSNS